MKRALMPGSVYFFALFALGFVLGTIRVIYVAPRVGQIVATLAEVPIMLAAGFLACRWTIRHWQVPDVLAVRWAMVLWFFVQLFVVETLLGAALFNRAATEQLAALTAPAGLLGLSAQIIAGVMPLFIGKRGRT